MDSDSEVAGLGFATPGGAAPDPHADDDGAFNQNDSEDADPDDEDVEQDDEEEEMDPSKKRGSAGKAFGAGVG